MSHGIAAMVLMIQQLEKLCLTSTETTMRVSGKLLTQGFGGMIKQRRIFSRPWMKHRKNESFVLTTM